MSVDIEKLKQYLFIQRAATGQLIQEVSAEDNPRFKNFLRGKEDTYQEIIIVIQNLEEK